MPTHSLQRGHGKRSFSPGSTSRSEMFGAASRATWTISLFWISYLSSVGALIIEEGRSPDIEVVAPVALKRNAIGADILRPGGEVFVAGKTRIEGERRVV